MGPARAARVVLRIAATRHDRNDMQPCILRYDSWPRSGQMTATRRFNAGICVSSHCIAERRALVQCNAMNGEMARQRMNGGDQVQWLNDHNLVREDGAEIWRVVY